MILITQSFFGYPLKAILSFLRKYNLFFLILIFVLGIFIRPHFSYAANPDQNDAGQIYKQQQDLEQLNNLPRSIPEIKTKTKAKIKDPNAVHILVKGFKFEGELHAVTSEDLQKLLVEFINQELTFEEIQFAVQKINDYYQSKGYFLAKAFLPKQEVEGGIVVIQINEGKLDSKKPYEIKGENLRIKKSFVESYIDQALQGKVNQNSLERGLLNIADNPGVTATADIEPGDEPGTSRIIVDTIEKKMIEATVSGSNYGSRYTGSNQISAGVNLNDLTHYGDQISFSSIFVPNEAFRLLKLGYSLPIGSSGLRAGISYSDLYFELGKEFVADPVSLGKSRNWNYNLRYPLYRTALTSLTLGGTYDWKSSYNETAGTVASDKRTNVGAVNLILEHSDTFLGGGFTQMQLTQVRGDVDLSRDVENFDSDQSDTGLKTNGGYSKTAFQLVRIQRGTERLSFQFIGAGQVSQKNLDGGEKFMLGGPAGIRAYPSGEASGDQGFKTSLDARYALFTGTKVGDITTSLFYDYGYIQQNKDSMAQDMTTPNNYTLQGWGVGLEANASGKFNLKALWAKPIGNNPAASVDTGNNSDGKPNESRWWLQGSVSF